MQQDEFSLRHIGPNESDIKKMLSSLDVESIEELLTQTIPQEIRLNSPLSLPKGISENKFLNEITERINHFDENYNDVRKFHIYKCITTLGRPFALCRFEENGVPHKVLIDTGCWRSLMNRITYLTLREIYGDKIKLEVTDVKLQSHSGQSIDVLGSLKWPIWLEDNKGNWTRFLDLNWIVTDDEKTMILGGSFLQARDGLVHYRASRYEDKRLMPASIAMYLPIFQLGAVV